ncbi:MAG: diguanylate cyclase, partial [Acidobacteriota bacterium]|nr:diguanylate cyclase [Acidobacteriota bacterium]
SLADDRVVSLFFGPDRILWVGTYRGISQLNFSRQNFMRFIPNPSDPNSLSAPAVRSFCQTSSGLLLVGTDGGGLDVFDRKNLRVLHYSHDPQNPRSLSSNRVFALAEDSDGTIWVGTNGGGLNRFNLSTSIFTHLRHDSRQVDSLIDDHIRSLFIDSKNRLWIGTDGSGLVRYDRRTGKFFRPEISSIVYPNEISEEMALSAIPQKTSSVAAAPSLSPQSSSAETTPSSSPDLTDLPGPPANPLLSGRILSMGEDKAGNLWIASFDSGLIRYNPETGKTLQFLNDPLDPQSLSSNAVVNVLVDSHGYVWVGTNGGGLNRLDPATFQFTRYTEAQGLPSSVIYAILEDDDEYLWFSSNRGLSRLDPPTGQIKNFDMTDGLQDYEFNGNACFKGRNGYLYFGGINGFNVFNPRDIKINDYMPPVVITNFSISNVPVRPGQPFGEGGEVLLKQSIFETSHLDLPWKYRAIAFEFAGLDYTCPGKNQYAYILEGFDKEWNYVGTRRFASYSNLPPGRYTFRVRASNSDGLWSDAATSLSLRIIPPFWRTWWFYGLCVLVLGGLVYSGFLVRTRQIRHHERELERLVAQRTEELKQANEKLQFLATTDEMTGVANYRRFREYLDYEWRRGYRTRKPVSLIICDLDDFKLFNDTYGHQAGDECLKKVAMTMIKCCQRSSDLVCRYGGDEFAVVLAETDTPGAYVVAERIREAIAALNYSDLDLKEINNSFPDHPKTTPKDMPRRVTACLGVATMNPVEGGDANELISRADQALYRAKSSGKNRTQV